MLKREFASLSLALALSGGASLAAVGDGPGAEPKPVETRIGEREFPSVFQAWNPADNLKSEDTLVTMARHDLVFHAPGGFALRWKEKPDGVATSFTPESVAAALSLRRKLLALNPNMILVAEIRYRDAHESYLPKDHKWWARDAKGKLVPGWEEGKYLVLDYRSPEFREHVAAQCKAAVATGVLDGVMLDWWVDDDDRLALVKAIRQAVGEKALILVNSNDRTAPRTASYVNGLFMECYRSKTAGDWRRIAETLAWAEKNLREPRINCLETWFHTSRQDLSLMRATTALSLTHSNGYCLFSDPNPLPSPDHLHDWYPFWEKCLGWPAGQCESYVKGASRREFEKGTVVYNPMGGEKITVFFPEDRKSLATGKLAREHELNAADGGIYLKPQAP